jgi:hypothetical protein
MKKNIILLSAVLLTLTIGQAATITSLSIKNKQDTLLTIGEKNPQLVAIKTNNNDKVSWSSSDTAIVSVDNQGKLTALKEGIATIYLKSDVDSIKTDSVVVYSDYSFAHYKSQYGSLLAKNKQINEKIKNDKPIRESDWKPNYLSYALLALALILLILLFLLWNKNVKYKNDIGHYKKNINHYKEIEDKYYADIIEFIQYYRTERRDDERKREYEKDSAKEREKSEFLAQQTVYQQPASPPVIQIQPQSLYADSITDGVFNHVKEQPNEETIFELKLDRTGDTQAKVIVYEPIYKRVIACHAFLDGCKTQILGSTSVEMLREGIATKDSSGKWVLSTVPEVNII